MSVDPQAGVWQEVGSFPPPGILRYKRGDHAMVPSYRPAEAGYARSQWRNQAGPTQASVRQDKKRSRADAIPGRAAADSKRLVQSEVEVITRFRFESGDRGCGALVVPGGRASLRASAASWLSFHSANTPSSVPRPRRRNRLRPGGKGRR